MPNIEYGENIDGVFLFVVARNIIGSSEPAEVTDEEMRQARRLATDFIHETQEKGLALQRMRWGWGRDAETSQTHAEIELEFGVVLGSCSVKFRTGIPVYSILQDPSALIMRRIWWSLGAALVGASELSETVRKICFPE